MRYETYLKKDAKALWKILWKYTSKYIVTRDKNVCFTCGKFGNMAGHFVHAGNSKNFLLDTDERNLNCQCSQCNFFLSGNLVVYGIKLQQKYGVEIAEELYAMKYQLRKVTKEELVDKIIYFKEKWENLNG